MVVARVKLEAGRWHLHMGGTDTAYVELEEAVVPVHLEDRKLQIFDCTLADIVESQFTVLLIRFPSNRPDQAQSAGALERKGRQKIGASASFP